MKTLKVNNIEITLSAEENPKKTEYTLTGIFNQGNFSFQIVNDPNNNKYNGNAIEITTSPISSNQISISHKGDPSKLWVWTQLEIDDIVGDPTTPRGTEVVVKGDDM